jgi:UDP-N-acetylglucosamine--dolichyl-phosphate N-acetylglucosaminephosphotransferase
MLSFALIFLVSTATSLVLSALLIPRLRKVGMTGNDINKPDRPEVAEMGGIAIVAAASGGMLLAIFLQTFFGLAFDLTFMLAAIITILMVGMIGFVDDLIDIPQKWKALLPLFAAIPLIVVKAAGSTAMAIPLIGTIDLGLIYIIVLIPIGIAVCSNLTNMLAGFNGMEAGMGVVMFLALALIALRQGQNGMLIIALSMLGALLGFLWFNRYPSKVFPGDVGNLAIGGALAVSVIIGNLESAGAILAVPYVIDFFIKAANRFPSRGWNGRYKDGRLYAPDKPVSFAQWVMRLSGGISEQRLALFFVGLEAVFAVMALALYAR